MKKRTLLFCLLLMTYFGSLFSQEVVSSKNSDSLRNEMANAISKVRLERHVEVISADSMEGRATGSMGALKARKYITDFYKRIKYTDNENALLQMFKIDDYPAENIIVSFEGDSLPQEVIVVSAHYDHMGTANGRIFNGADDNASGTAALMEMIRVMTIAYRAGIKPKRTVLFIHFSAEELGLWGSKVFVNNTSIPKENFYANINLDMVGRVDFDHRKKPNYVYTIGMDYFGNDLANILLEVNKETVQLELNKRYNAQNHVEQLHRRTDSFPFAANGIPFVFFTSGSHKDYHQPTDTSKKIELDPLYKRTQLAMALTWELANQPEKLELDPNKVLKYKNEYSKFLSNGLINTLSPSEKREAMRKAKEEMRKLGIDF